VRDGGAIVSLRRGEATDDPRLHQRYILVTDEMENPTALAGLGELFADGILAPRVAVRLPISEAAEAHRLVEKGGLPGRVVLVFDGESEQ
jgi:NADPH:quinone reductase-like Zn-dependent oxidoreductase